jgi:transcriptional regulator with XRE-family HTH domain
MRLTPQVHHRFAAELERYRKRNKLTISSLSRLLGRSRPTISRWLSKKNPRAVVNYESAAQVAQQLHLHADYIFGAGRRGKTLSDLFPLTAFREQVAAALAVNAYPIAKQLADHALLAVYHHMRLYQTAPRLLLSDVSDTAIYFEFPKNFVTFIFEVHIKEGLMYSFLSIQNNVSTLLHQGELCDDAVLDVIQCLRTARANYQKQLAATANAEQEQTASLILEDYARRRSGAVVRNMR